MAKPASKCSATKLAMPENLVTEIDRMVAKMNTPADRAAREALFAASSADLGRAAMKARKASHQSKAP